MASIIERIDLGCASNPMRVLISLTAAAVGIYHPGWVQTDMGGAKADITVDESSSGLLRRFDLLGPDTTGCFEMWNGEAMPY